MEDVLLKQNVPGQYSNWGRGDDQRGPDARADDLDDSDCESGTEKDPPMQVWVWISSYQSQYKRYY